MQGDLDKSSSRLFRLENKALWPRHPLGNPILGSAKSLLKIDRESLLAFHDRHYMAKGALFVAAGNLNHDQIVDMVSPALYSLSDRPETPYRAASRCQAVTPVVFEDRNETRVKFRILFRSPNDDDGRNARFNILLNILGSRLFQAVRRKRGLAYSIDSYILMYSDVTVFKVNAEVDVNNLAKVIILCGRELRKMVETPVSNRELKHAKNCLINGELLDGEDSYSRMRLLGHFLRRYGSVITTAEMIKIYESVTAQEIQQFAAEIFRPENCSLAMLLPNDCQVSPEKLRELLGNELQ